MTRDAQVVEADNAVVPVVLAAGSDPAEQVRQLGKLRRAGSDTREGVGCVVDDDRDGELVEFGTQRPGSLSLVDDASAGGGGLNLANRLDFGRFARPNVAVVGFVHSVAALRPDRRDDMGVHLFVPGA